MEKTGRGLDFRKVIFQQGGCSRGKDRQGLGEAGKFRQVGDAVDAIGLLMEPVVAQFVPDVEQDEKAAGHAYRQTKDIDQGEGFAAVHISDGYEPVVFVHETNLRKGS